MFDFEDDMKQTFLEEAQTLIDETEAAFIALDEGDRSPELIDMIFRLAHNFKSSAKTVGLSHLSEFAHLFEDVLNLIKGGHLEPTKPVCTILLKTLDDLRAYVSGLRADLTYVHDTTTTWKSLNQLKEQPAGSASAEDDAMAALLAEVMVDSSLSDGPVKTSVAADDFELFESEKPKPLPQAVTAPILPVVAQKPAEVPAAPAATSSPAGKSPKIAAEDENLKVSRKKLDTLMNLIGELVVYQSMVTRHKGLGSLDSDESVQILNSMEKIMHELQDISLSLRLVPVAPLFQKLKRIARDASGDLGKTIAFRTEGEHVEIDKSVLDRISDPLTHLIRNAVDHGVETDAERVGAGKSVSSSVVLTAQQQEDRVLITISDDGRGMNKDILIAKAIQKNLIPADSVLTDDEAYRLIFKPGFSTKEQVTDISGRGVGMDVVSRAVEDLKGKIQIKTQLGKGTQFEVSLPLSMSILTGMVVKIDDEKYVIPINQLLETVELENVAIETSTGDGRMFNLRGDVIPIFSLSSILHPRLKRSARRGTGLITAFEGRKYSFEIDAIYGQQEIVLKKLGSEMRGLPGILAGAILSTGEPGLVLNLNDFFEKGVIRASS